MLYEAGTLSMEMDIGRKQKFQKSTEQLGSDYALVLSIIGY